MKFSEYKIEDMKLLNMEMVESQFNRRAKDKLFKIELDMNAEQKKDFLKEYDNGKSQVLYDMLSKWEMEKNTLPKDEYGYIKTVSRNAWIKRNLPQNTISISTFRGSIYFTVFSESYDELSTTTPTAKYLVWEGENIINQWFHDVLVELREKEHLYFRTKTPKGLKITKLENMIDDYGRINIREFPWDSNGLSQFLDSLSEEKIDYLIGVYDSLEKISLDVRAVLSKAD